ncbi:MAG: di-heme oxidoredictase family protein [Myxococcota bacterium]
MRRLGPSILLLSSLSLMSACGGCGPEEPEGVATDIYADLGEPMQGASASQREAFDRGREVALRQFGPESGLGPKFNVTSCGGCHERPVTGGSGPRYRNFYMTGSELSDGSVVLLGRDGVQRQFSVESPHRVPTDADSDFFVTRNPVPFFGMGALAEIPEESILEHADPDDTDGDGISGRPNYDRGFVGRFGRKAQTVSLEGFVRGPLFNHVGITSNPLPDARKAELPVPSDSDGAPRTRSFQLGPEGEACINCQAAAPEEPLEDSDDVPDPELSEDDLFDLVSFTMLLGAPEPEPLEGGAKAGRDRFESIGCADCHVPGLSGPRGKVMAYTDLLLHDMGPELADNLSQGLATGSEFRTAPLWGVVATGPYLHDGRADTLDQAIRMHGGEGQAAADAYQALSSEQRGQIIAFLESLGGGEIRSDGLIPPGEPAPDPGEFGGPGEALSGQNLALFERGRAIFDGDIAKREGLGPVFNGDSCRACHFEPTVGGAGPAGVNVIRQGIVQGDTFFAVDGSDIVHRFNRDETIRPEPDPTANVFEMRQSPALFGTGLIDAIPESEILANADPNDDDGDEISGRAAMTPSGAVGRFGWKAVFPSLEAFVRDALSNEVGLTVRADDAFTAGITMDDDGVPDPEFFGEDFEALMFYSRMLSAPPNRNDESTETAGQALFRQTGCAKCHVPELEMSDGTPVRLYSDLLLHDVAPADYRGIESGDATMYEFRTPPLWGVGQTAPYMHDGLSETLDDAIMRHDGEARSVRQSYEALSEEDRSLLIDYLRGI